MTKASILELARKLMNQHGYGHLPIKVGNAKRTLGTAVFGRDGTPRELRLSAAILSRMPQKAEDTILHEIAHFIAGHKAGHGPRWKSAARRIGADPTRTAHVEPDTQRELSNYVSVCETCGTETYLVRRPKHPMSQYRHKGCGGTFGPLQRLR